MAYFQENRLLFVHIPKNAGRSVYVALGLIEIDKIGKPGRRSFLNRIATFGRKITSDRRVKHQLYGTLDYIFAAQHLTLQEIELLHLIPRPELLETRKFAIVRDPFDRALSTFFHFNRDREPTKTEFERFCLTWFDKESLDHNQIAHRRRQIDFIRKCDGSIGVDRLLIFDDLKRELELLCCDYEIPIRVALPHVGRRTTVDTRGLYTALSRSEINRRFAEDIEIYERVRQGKG